MATFVARKLCPHLRTVSSDHKLYSECSKKIMAVLGRFGPMTPASQDEAYCSVTQYCQDHNLTPAEVGEKMRAGMSSSFALYLLKDKRPNDWGIYELRGQSRNGSLSLSRNLAELLDLKNRCRL